MSEPPRNKLWVYGPRLAVIVLLGATTWYVLQLYHAVVDGPAAAKTAGSTEPDVPASPTDVLGLIPPGPWQMAGWDWDLRVREVSAADLRQALDTPPPDGSSGDHKGLDRVLLGLARQLDARPARHRGGTVYRASSPAVNLRLFTRGEGADERLLAARLALAQPPDWRLLELRPRGPAATGDDGPGGLLPWPDGCERVAARRDDEGRLVAEFLVCRTTLAQLREHLKKAGWAHAALGGVLSYRKKERMIYLWAPGPGRDGQQALLAVRAGRPAMLSEANDPRSP